MTEKDYAELKAENEKLQEKLSGKRFICKDCMAFAKKIEQYKQTLQEIKEIAETELSYDMVGNEHRHYRNYDFIRHLITKAESEG